MPDATEATRLAALFAGNEDYHGYHGEPDRDEDIGKWSIKTTARTVRDTVTLTHWELHLRGERPLGVAPIMSDARCRWGSIDIDDYDVDAIVLVKKIESLKYPLVTCRSKSGGVHLFLFLREPEPASTIQGVLRDVAASLGHAGAEVFPKQSSLDTKRGDLPNWIVMPYFGSDYDGKLRMQRGIKRSGNEMTLDEFLRAAEASLTSTNDIKVRRRAATTRRSATPGSAVEDVPFGDGPVCLQHIVASGGVQAGGQNNALFMMGLYYRRAHPEDWKDKLEEANSRFLDPPGSASGLMDIIRSIERKEGYLYTCKKTPMVDHCNSTTCRIREFGVGEAGNFPLITSVERIRSEPVQWFLEVEGTRLSMRSETLMEYRLFRKLCLEKFGHLYAPLKDGDWTAIVSEALKNVTELSIDPDVGDNAEFLELLTTYLTNRQRGKRMEDLIAGRPWEDVDGVWGRPGAYYLNIPAFMKFLDKKSKMDRAEANRRVKAMGGEAVEKNIKGNNRYLRMIPGNLIPKLAKLEAPREPEEEI